MVNLTFTLDVYSIDNWQKLTLRALGMPKNRKHFWDQSCRFKKFRASNHFKKLEYPTCFAISSYMLCFEDFSNEVKIDYIYNFQISFKFHKYHLQKYMKVRVSIVSVESNNIQVISMVVAKHRDAKRHKYFNNFRITQSSLTLWTLLKSF